MWFSEQKLSDRDCSLNQDLGVFIFLDAFFNFFSSFHIKTKLFLELFANNFKNIMYSYLSCTFHFLDCTVCWIFQKGEVNFTTYIDSTKFVRYYLKRHRNFWETNHNIGCLCSFILTFIWDKIFTWRVKHISSFFSCQMGAKTTTFSCTYFLYIKY